MAIRPPLHVLIKLYPVGGQSPDLRIPETGDWPLLRELNPQSQTNELVKLGIEVGTASVLVAALAGFAPQVLPEVLPELSELASSAPELFEAVTTRFNQSRVGEFFARLGRWRIPPTGETASFSESRLAEILSGEREVPIDMVRDPETGQFFEDIDEDQRDYVETMYNIQQLRNQLQEFQQGVENEAFFDAELIETNSEAAVRTARQAVQNTIQRIDDAGFRLYRFVNSMIP